MRNTFNSFVLSTLVLYTSGYVDANETITSSNISPTFTVQGDRLAGSCASLRVFSMEILDANNDGHWDLFAATKNSSGQEQCLATGDGAGNWTKINYGTAAIGHEAITRKKDPTGLITEAIDSDGDGFEEIVGNNTSHGGNKWEFNTTKVDGASPTWIQRDHNCMVKGRGYCSYGFLRQDSPMEMIRDSREIIELASQKSLFPTAGLPSNGRPFDLIDINQDSWPDICSTEQYGCYLNNNGRFNTTLTPITGLTCGTKHRAWADFDNDGDLDLWCTTKANDIDCKSGKAYATGCHDGMHRNNGGMSFTLIPDADLDALGWQVYRTVYAGGYTNDFNNDGCEDIAIGHTQYTEGMVVMEGDCAFGFTKAFSTSQMCESSLQCKPAHSAKDYDGDGLVDIFTLATLTEAGTETDVYDWGWNVYKNTTTTTDKYLAVNIKGEGDNNLGLHATIKAFKPGTSTLLKYAVSQSNIYSSNSNPIHLGMGFATRVDVEITWPHGRGSKLFSNIETNQCIKIDFNGSAAESTISLNHTPCGK